MIGYILAFLLGYALRNHEPIAIRVGPSRPMTRQEQYCFASMVLVMGVVLLMILVIWTGVYR